MPLKIICILLFLDGMLYIYRMCILLFLDGMLYIYIYSPSDLMHHLKPVFTY